MDIRTEPFDFLFRVLFSLSTLSVHGFQIRNLTLQSFVIW